MEQGQRPARAGDHPDQLSATGNRSLTLERGLRLLRVLAEHPEGLSVSAAANELGTHRAGVYRLLGPLVEQRLVHRNSDGRHTLGVGLLELASAVQPQLLEVALPELQRLADEMEATTALTVREGEEAVVVAVIEPRSAKMHIAYRRGLRHPLDVAASGVALLAAGPPLPGERKEVTAARRRGYSLTHGELFPSASGVGAAIAAPDEPAAAISIVWVDSRDEKIAAEAVVRSARSVEAMLR